MDKYLGTWKEESSQNKEAMVKARLEKAPEDLKKKIEENVSSPISFLISKEGEDEYKIEVRLGELPINAMTLKPGVEFEFTAPWGEKLKSLLTIDDGKIKMDQTDSNGKTAKILLAAEGDTLKMEETFGDAPKLELSLKKQ